MAAYLERSHEHYMRSGQFIGTMTSRSPSIPVITGPLGNPSTLVSFHRWEELAPLSGSAGHSRGMEKIEESSNDAFRKFRSMYSSCMSYEEVNETMRVDQARNVLYEVGWIQNKTSWDFTQLIYDLLIHHRY
ncbi:unnamed protein product, partial [Timema podura]|nr:unnamed protein product [Timema podura]